jgi:hypothetical protein
MVQKSLTFQAICEAVEIQYRTFKDQKEWLPAKNVRDSKAPPTQYGANLVEEKPLTRTEFMALMQSGFAGRSGTCPKSRLSFNRNRELKYITMYNHSVNLYLRAGTTLRRFDFQTFFTSLRRCLKQTYDFQTKMSF